MKKNTYSLLSTDKPYRNLYTIKEFLRLRKINYFASLACQFSTAYTFLKFSSSLNLNYKTNIKLNNNKETNARTSKPQIIHPFAFQSATLLVVRRFSTGVYQKPAFTVKK